MNTKDGPDFLCNSFCHVLSGLMPDPCALRSSCARYIKFREMIERGFFTFSTSTIVFDDIEESEECPYYIEEK